MRETDIRRQAVNVARSPSLVIVASVLVEAILGAPDAAAGAATVAELTAELGLATRRHAD
jgi:tryptophan synthase alpha chain